MPDSRKPDGVGKIVEAAKRILDTVLPGASRTPTARPPERRPPIPPTPPPRLLRAPASLPARPRSSAEQQVAHPPADDTHTAGAPPEAAVAEVTPGAPAETTLTRPSKTAQTRTAKKAGEKRATETAEPGMPPEAVAGLARAERPHRGGEEPPYEQLTKAELYELAQQRDIPGRSTMSKGQLIEALRMR